MGGIAETGNSQRFHIAPLMVRGGNLSGVPPTSCGEDAWQPSDVTILRISDDIRQT